MAKNNQIALRQSNALVKKTESSEALVTPAADIYETSDAFIVKLDVPGAKKECIQVTAEKGKLLVKCPVESFWREDGRVLFSEIGRKSYFREFNLGEGINHVGIQATLENAVITVTLPKSDSLRVKEIIIH